MIFKKQSEATQNQLPPGLSYIVGNEAAERFGYYGMRTILMVFMTKYLLDNLGNHEFTNIEAMIWFHNFISASYFLPICGAFIADALWGKYKTIIVFSIIYCFGYLILIFFNTKAGLFWGLITIAIGSGGIKPCVISHVGDQFNRKSKQLIGKGYSWFYFAISLGPLFSMSLIPSLLTKYGPKIAFMVPGLLMLISTAIFYCGRKVYITIPPIGWQKYKEILLEEDNKKAFKNLSIVFLFIAFYFALEIQFSSSWVIQATKMNRNISLGSFKLNPDPSQIQILEPIFTLMLVPFLTYIIYPFLQKFIHITYLKRIATGFFFCAASFTVIAIAQLLIDSGKEVSVIWQVWAFILLVISDVLIIGTCYELIYLYTPNPIKSTLYGLFFAFTIAAGSKITAFISFLIEKKYIPLEFADANYFFAYTGLIMVVGLLFILYIPHYQGKIYFQLMKESLPKKLEPDQLKIKRIIDIILRTGGKEINMILLYNSLIPVSMIINQSIDISNNIGKYANYNFLILIKNNKPERPNYIATLENGIKNELKNFDLKFETLSHLNDDISLTIKTIDEFNLELERKRYFSVRKEGILLYNSKNFELLKRIEEIEVIRKKNIRRNYEHWYKKGLEFIDLARFATKKSYTGQAAFNLHQATESFYNCCLFVMIGDKPKHHDLRELNILLCTESNQFYNLFPAANNQEKKCFNLLQESYIKSRYNFDYSISVDQLRYLFSRVERLKSITKEVCEEEIGRSRPD